MLNEEEFHAYWKKREDTENRIYKSYGEDYQIEYTDEQIS